MICNISVLSHNKASTIQSIYSTEAKLAKKAKLIISSLKILPYFVNKSFFRKQTGIIYKYKNTNLVIRLKIQKKKK